VEPITREYQLCLKCHSSYAYGNSPPPSHTGGITQTDQAKEFNVNNGSYHWVETDRTADSGYTPRSADPQRTFTFAPGSGWTATSRMNCSDCHGSASSSAPRGVHGSSEPYLLRGTWGAGQQGLCLQCHDPGIYGANADTNAASQTGFSDQQDNLHAKHMGNSWVASTGCMACHSAIPHGSQYPALLAPRRLPNGSRPPEDDYNRLSVIEIDRWAPSRQWSEGDCSGCH
jgi:nitrate reductase cytochrome c-type subunit